MSRTCKRFASRRLRQDITSLRRLPAAKVLPQKERFEKRFPRLCQGQCCIWSPTTASSQLAGNPMRSLSADKSDEEDAWCADEYCALQGICSVSHPQHSGSRRWDGASLRGEQGYASLRQKFEALIEADTQVLASHVDQRCNRPLFTA